MICEKFGLFQEFVIYIRILLPKFLSPSILFPLSDQLFNLLLLFDKSLHRLGYGGGFYDRTIQHFRQKDNTKFIGICYPAQIIPKLPRVEHDQKLDFLVNLDEI